MEEYKGLDFSKPAEQLCNECLMAIAEAQIKAITAIHEENVADSAYEAVKFALTIDAKSGKAEAELGIGKITESVAEAWLKTKPAYIQANEARDAARLKKYAASQMLALAEIELRCALAIVSKDTKLALTQT